MYIDTHAHLTDGAFDHDRQELIKGLAAGGIGIVRAAFFRRGIVRDHRVNIAAVDEHRIAWPSHREEIMLIAEIRLTKDRDLIACVLEYTGNDRRTE